MNDDTVPQTVLFPDLFDRPARRDLRSAARELGWRRGVAQGGRRALRPDRRASRGCLVDDRQPGKSAAHARTICWPSGSSASPAAIPTPTTPTGWPTTRSRSCCSDRDPIDGDPLASQPTISRFENQRRARRPSTRWAGRWRASVIARHRQRLHGRARRITIDLDPTDDPTHGAQQLTFFNGHYDSWCYLPLLAFLTFNDEAEQYLCAAVLRPGNAPATRGALGAAAAPARRCCASRFRTARFLVRLDGGFATPEMLRLPRRRTRPRLRRRHGRKRGVDAGRRARDGRGAGAERGERADRTSSIPRRAMPPARGRTSAAW